MSKTVTLLLALALTGCATNYKQATPSPNSTGIYECERDAAPVQERGRNSKWSTAACE